MEHIELIRTTIKEVYPNYLVKKILKSLEQKNVISYKENLFSKENTFVFSNHDGESSYHPRYDTEELLIALTEKENEVIAEIQEQEYNSPYSYSIIFEVHNDWDESLNNAIKQGLVQEVDLESLKKDSMSKTIQECIPSYYKKDNFDILKFSLHLTGYLPQEADNKRDIVYPIICLFNKENKFLEIRYEKAKGYISNAEDGFYVKRITELKDKIESLLLVDLLAVNLSPIVKYIKESLNNNEDQEIAVSAQALEYHTGSKAVLDTGNNDNMILPLIGNLRDILKYNSDLFNANEQTIEIESLLNEIILEAELLSDHPWITLAWKNEVKSKILKVKFLFNYQGQDYSVLQYYGSNADSERMSYVTQFIFDNKKKLEHQSE